MERLKKLWNGEQPYEPISDGSADGDAQELDARKEHLFSYINYSIFLLLGISMLWAWNMFLAAGPYFQRRFKSNEWISDNFQAAEITVGTVTNLVAMLVLTRMQTNASYPRRIMGSLFINMVIFTLASISTRAFLGVSAEGYFGFLMVIMFSSALAMGLCQNGIFAYVSGFGEPSYTQGIMTGQAIAGVLPCIAEIVSILSIESDASPRQPTDDGVTEPPPVPSLAAMAYFLTATAISVAALFAFLSLLARNRRAGKTQDASTTDTSDDSPDQTKVSLIVLFRKLFWLACAVFITFGVTMVAFPVFTQQIVSVRPLEDQPRILHAPSFIPLGFLFWNTGDLLGRLVSSAPSLSLVQRPKVVFCLAIARVVWAGFYHLCNIGDRGAVIESDFFYLVIVQLLFGISNGYLGSTCMIGASEWVEPEEREAAGGFMGLCLVSGLCVGSFLSFFAAAA